VALASRAGWIDLQVKIDLQAVAEATRTKSVEAPHAGHGEDVLRKVAQDGLSRRSVEQVSDRPSEQLDAFGTHPASHDEANHLVEVERIMDISARLVVNQAALKLKREPIRALIDAFERAVR
jgi:hypothetical protein